MVPRRQRIRSGVVVGMLAGPAMLLACGGDSPTDPPTVAQLSFVTQPAAAEGQARLDPSIRVAIQDAAGQTVTGASSIVTVSLVSNSAGAVLSGTTTVRAVQGIATFTDLSVDLPGDGFVLEARRTGLPAITSAPFSVHLSFAQVSIGQVHTCGVTTAGFAYCWGSNESGQLGTGTHDDHHTPWPVKGRLRFRQISLGPHHTCGATSDSSAYCWGDNVNGFLGDGTTDERQEPTLVQGGSHFLAVYTADHHSCGLTGHGAVYCWGLTWGDNNDAFFRFIPTPVTGGPAFQQITVGQAHTCGLTADSVVYCWGLNNGGQLGDSTGTSRTSPTRVAGGLKFSQVSAGYAYTCGVAAGQVAYCWGWGGDGNLGDGTTSTRWTPAAVTGGLSFAKMSAGGFWHTCGVTTANAAYCWGHGTEGQLGDGTMSAKLVPTVVAGGVSFVRISAGIYHTCGVTASQLAYCWGSNDYGTLGDGTVAASGTPRQVAH